MTETRRLRAALVWSCALHLAVLLAPLDPAGAPGRGGSQQRRIDATLLAPRAPALPGLAQAAPPAVPAPSPRTEPAPAQRPGHPGGGAVVYFAANEVDVAARLLEGPDMVIPQDAYNKRIPGRVHLSLYINASGGVDFVEALAAEPPGVYEEIVVRAAAQSRYTPARRFGRPVASRKDIVVDIDPYETIARP